MNRRRVNGSCAICHQPIKTGQRAAWVARKGWCHVSCQRTARGALRGLADAIDQLTAATTALADSVRTANTQ